MDELIKLAERFENRASFFLAEANKGFGNKKELIGAHTAYVDAAIEVRKLCKDTHEMEIYVDDNDMVVKFYHPVTGIKLNVVEAITYLRAIEKCVSIILTDV